MNLTHNQHLDNDGKLHVHLSKTMSRTDILMTISVPAADAGTTTTITEEPSVKDLLVVISSTEL